MDQPHDPFEDARRERAILDAEFQGDSVPMMLRYDHVRDAAKDWRTFSSDAPFRVPIPSEEDVRSVRQLPIEVDPPEHTAYRKIVTPIFRRPNQPEMIAQVDALMGAMFDEALGGSPIEVVREFALPIQSRALAYLLKVPQSEAEEWVSWGIHVFRDGGSGEKRGAALEAYIHRQLDAAESDPGDDFFSDLTLAEFEGRKLTREEMVGFVNLTFAGGRDTVIHSISAIVAYLGRHPERLEELRGNPKLLLTATEEFMRTISPLTHIGRVCPHDTDVHGTAVVAGQRVSLCWASANYDPEVFDAPEELRFDRRPNPHIAFGSGAHICLGAAHARLIVRKLLEALCERVSRIEILQQTPHLEDESSYCRQVGYDSLEMRLHGR